jgi:DNA-binding NtrC family response regulator
MHERRFKVLVVDDDEGARDSLKMILEDEYDVLDAESGTQALDLFGRIQPDLVFLDKIMPDMGGLDVLVKMKMVRPMTPVVIFTAYSNLADAAEALEKGASDYIAKPFSVKEIRDQTAILLNGRETNPINATKLRHRWMMRKRDIRRKFIRSAFVPTS